MKNKHKKKKNNNYIESEIILLLKENLNLYKKIDELNERNEYLENRLEKIKDTWNNYKYHEKINGVWLERESDVKIPRNPYRLPLDEIIDPILTEEEEEEDELSENQQQLLF